MTEAAAPGSATSGPTALGPRPRIGVGTKALYGFGSIAFGIKDNGFRVFLLLFYNQVVGLPAVTVAIAIGIATFIDCLIDPFIGRLSDNFRSPWGRRHPFMYASALPVALSFLLLWNPPTDWDEGALIAYLAVVVVIARTFIVFYEIPSSSMSAELTNDYTERSAILGWRYFFAWWGGLTLTVAMFWFLMKATPEYPVGQLNPEAYKQYGYIGAFLMFVSIIVSSAGTHRFIPWMPKAPPKQQRSVAAELKEVFHTLNIRPFLAITAVGLVASVATGIGFSLAFYFTTYFWKLDPFWTGVLQIDSYISATIALFAAPMLTRRSGKKFAGGMLLMASVLVGFLPLFLRLIGFFPGDDALVPGTKIPQVVAWLFLDGTIRGILGITASILITAMLSDVVEYSEQRTGRRSEGLFFAFTSLIQKAVSGVGVLVAGGILAIVNFPEGAKPADVPQEVVNNLAWVYMPTLIILYGLAVGILQFYNITRESHEATVRELEARTQAAEDGAPSQAPT
jgi:Na+/melibiose symporter-like transporter